jgi:hypothetical protein
MRSGARTTPPSESSLAYELSSASAPGTRVQDRAPALADLQLPAVQRAHPQGRSTGRLVLRDALFGNEHARAQHAARLVDPGPTIDETEPVGSAIERIDLGRRVVLAERNLRSPLRPGADPAQSVFGPRGDLARRRAQHVAGAALARDQPSRADQRVTSQRQLAGGRVDPQLAARGVVDEDRLAVAELGGDRLATIGRDRRAVEEHAQRIPVRPVIRGEDVQELVARHSSIFAGRLRANLNFCLDSTQARLTGARANEEVGRGGGDRTRDLRRERPAS